MPGWRWLRAITALGSHDAADRQRKAQCDTLSTEACETSAAKQREADERLSRIEVRIAAYTAEVQMNERAMQHGRG